MKTREEIINELIVQNPSISINGTVYDINHDAYHNEISQRADRVELENLEFEANSSRKIWKNGSDFLEEFMIDGDLSKIIQIQTSSNPVIIALRFILSVWKDEIWSDDSRIVMGMNALVSDGIISEEEKTFILSK